MLWVAQGYSLVALLKIIPYAGHRLSVHTHFFKALHLNKGTQKCRFTWGYLGLEKVVSVIQAN